MNSLKGRLFFVPAVSLFVLAVAIVTLFVYMRNAGAEEEAKGTALRVAAMAANFSVTDFGRDGDHERAAIRIAKTINGSAEYASVVISGTSGRIIGSIPTKASRIDASSDPDCNTCHSGGKPSVTASVALRPDGIETVRAVAMITTEGSCRKCHAHAKSLGHAYVQMPTESIRDKAFTEKIIFAALVFIGSFGLFAALAYYKAKQVYQPVLEAAARLAEAVKSGSVGETSGPVPAELKSLMEKASAGADENSEGNPKLMAALDYLSGPQVRLKAAVSEIRALAEVENNVTGKIGKGLLRLRREVDEVSGSVDLIAASTEDNSSSLSELTGSVNKVASDAEQLSMQVKRSTGSVQQMSRSVQVIAEQVELLSRSVEAASGKVGYIESSAVEIKTNAIDSADLSGEMSSSATVGSEAVKIITESITSSYHEIMIAAESMRALKKASIAVGGILKIINEINDKTKLLALNAAIIAAQAGEQGRSFAVVAHEIKGLSDRTAASTGDIGRITETIQEGVEKALGNVSKSEEKLSSSVDAVSQAGSLLSGIAVTATEAYEKTMLIKEAVERQAGLTQDVAFSVGQVAQMVDEIKRRVKDHGSGAEFVEASSNAMCALTEQVKQTVREQADTSRYLSEAFTIIDVHMKGVLRTISANTDLIGSMEDNVNDVNSAFERLSAITSGVLEAADSIDAGIEEVKKLLNGTRSAKEV